MQRPTERERETQTQDQRQGETDLKRKCLTETPRQTKRKKPRERRNKERQVKKCSRVVPDRQTDKEQWTRRERGGGRGREGDRVGAGTMGRGKGREVAR